jgi:alpha-beta hydrolase superfamily lysophospholipase
VTPRPISLEAADGCRLDGREVVVAEAPAAVVLAHGLCASMDEPEFHATVSFVAECGYTTVSYDARGHGTSGGESTLGDAERLDVGAAVEHARRLHERVVVVGASMGAIAVLRYATGDPDLSGVVTISCPDRWQLPRTVRAVLAASLTRTRPGRWVTCRYMGARISPEWTAPEPPVDLVRQLTVPLAVVHGTHDRFIPPAAAGHLADAATGPVSKHLVQGMGHAYDRAALLTLRRTIAWCLDKQPAVAS